MNAIKHAAFVFCGAPIARRVEVVEPEI